MKTNIVSLLLILNSWVAFSQKEFSDEEMNKMKSEVKTAALKLRKTLEQAEETKFSIDFKIDTFTIEELTRLRIDNDYSTSGMIQSIYDAEVEYDKLLNKYYKILLNELDSVDKELLKQTQKNWLTFRDSERKMSALLGQKEKYSGGGSMNREFIASHYLSLTQLRAAELYHYISRLNSFGN